ncbi:MAG: hypothetical protein ACI8ZN_000470 [Bacteroidia bacterium]|jgi:hypothetical protein
MKFIKYLWLTVASIVSIVILWINLQLYTGSNSIGNQKGDVIKQLNFLENELKTNDLGTRMQNLFPEGLMFVNALYGLSWCELALGDSTDEIVKQRALAEALYSFNEINSSLAQATFHSGLEPEFGIFYCGWRNYLLSKILLVDTSFENAGLFIHTFKAQSQEISLAMERSSTPYLASYGNQFWPGDQFVAMASLSNYNRVFEPRYKSALDAWMEDVKQWLDPFTDLVPHKVDGLTKGAIEEGARGSSIGLILRMLGDIDPKFGKDQFEFMKRSFLTTTFGLPSVREYPIGITGNGDIDSGPVIFDVGFSATIMMIGTLSMYDHRTEADELYKTIHAFGACRSSQKRKSYILGALPMADAFIAWGRATDYATSKKNGLIPSKFWALWFQLRSLLIFALLWLPFFGRKMFNKIRNSYFSKPE